MYVYAHTHAHTYTSGFKKASAPLFSAPCRRLLRAHRLLAPRRCLSQGLRLLLQLAVPPGGGCSAPHHHARCQMLGPEGPPGFPLLEGCWGFGGTSSTCILLCSSLLAWSNGNPSLDAWWGWGGGGDVDPHCNPLADIPASAPAGRPLLEIASPPESLSSLLLWFFFSSPFLQQELSLGTQ